MRYKILFVTALMAIPLLVVTSKAQARGNSDEYCREYTKTVSINGRAERAYGTACYKPDGSWEIVDLKGSPYARDQVRDVMYDDIERQVNYRDRERIIIVENYDRRPARYYRPHNRYHSVAYNSWPFVINWNINSNSGYHKSRYNKKKHHYKKHSYKHAKHAPVIVNVKSGKNSKYKKRDDRRRRNHR